MSSCNNPVPAGAPCPVCGREHTSYRRPVALAALTVVAALVIWAALMIRENWCPRFSR